MVSIIARPTKSVREIVPAASGCRAIASIAAATDRPSARAGPIEPIETASAATIVLISFMSIENSSAPLGGVNRGADEHRGERGEDVGLHQTDKDLEGHQRDRHKQPGKPHDERNDKLAAHDVAEEPYHQREGAGYFGDNVERQHDRLGLGEARQISE